MKLIELENFDVLNYPLGWYQVDVGDDNFILYGKWVPDVLYNDDGYPYTVAKFIEQMEAPPAPDPQTLPAEAFFAPPPPTPEPPPPPVDPFEGYRAWRREQGFDDQMHGDFRDQENFRYAQGGAVTEMYNFWDNRWEIGVITESGRRMPVSIAMHYGYPVRQLPGLDTSSGWVKQWLEFGGTVAQLVAMAYSAYGMANLLNGALSIAKESVSNVLAEQAATQAAEEAAFAAAQAAEDAAIGASMLEQAGMTYAEFIASVTPTTVPDIDIFAEGDAGMAEALANPTLPPEFFPAEELVGGAEGSLPSDSPSPSGSAGGASIPTITASSGAGVLTTAAGLAKAGAGILSVLMAGGAGGAGGPKPNTIVPPGGFGPGPGVIDPNSLSVQQSSAVPLLLLGAGVLLAMKG